MWYSFGNKKRVSKKKVSSKQQFKITKKDVLIGMEATGHYWLAAHEFLQLNGFNIKVINSI